MLHLPIYYDKKTVIPQGAFWHDISLKDDFGSFSTEETVDLQIATQETVQGTIRGPVRIQVEGFRAVYNERND